MLCPECKTHVNGGSACPHCGNPVPERESFGGQGSHYFWVLALVTLGVFLLFFAISIINIGFIAAISRLFASRWSWLYLLLFTIPLAIGVYTSAALRNEEITVTDTYIARQSRWGNQKLLWAQIRIFRCIPLFPRESLLRRLFSLRRYVSREWLVWHLPPLAYELVGYADNTGDEPLIRLEPGTIDELPWLLELIHEHVGQPVEEC